MKFANLLSKCAHSFCNPNSKVKKIGKCFENLKEKENNNPFAIYILCEDNSALIFKPDGKQISTVYPPPTAKELLAMEYSMNLNRFIILLASGTICVYRFDKETAILEKLQYPNQLRDSEGKAMSQTICTLNFVSVIPPKYDCEVVREGSESNDEILEENKNEDMMVLGFSKGTFVFVHVKDIETIYARFSIHRQAINQIKQLNNKGIFASICAELSMNIWGFTTKNIVVYQTLKIYRNIREISCNEDKILMSFETTDCELFYWNHTQKELEIYHKEKQDDHDGRITCIDSIKTTEIKLKMKHASSLLMLTKLDENEDQPEGLYVTGGVDGYVKVWNDNKELIREICFPEEINTVSFLNTDCDILIGHGPKVSIILSKDYKPFEKQINENIEIEEEKKTEVYPKKSTVTDRTFEKLRNREIEIKAELMMRGEKKKKRNKFDVDESFSFDDSNAENNMSAQYSRKRIDPHSKHTMKFKNEGSLSDISYSKDNESEEELVTEEMFQKVLAETKLEMNAKKRKPKFKVYKAYHD